MWYDDTEKAVSSIQRSNISDPDPQSKRWCEVSDHEPPAKPGVCSDDTDQTYAVPVRTLHRTVVRVEVCVFLELFTLEHY